jgi:uncharacterized membrane protein
MMGATHDGAHMGWGRKVALGIVVTWFLVGGVAHFLLVDAFVSVVPPSLPQPVLLVYVSGVFEILGAVGVMLPRWRRRAGIGLVLLTIAVTPANVYMWQHPELFPVVSQTFLTIRLWLQLVLIACIAWSTWPAHGYRRA